MDRVDRIDPTDIETAVPGTDTVILNHRELIDRLNVMVDQINRLQENWERTSDTFQDAAET